MLFKNRFSLRHKLLFLINFLASVSVCNAEEIPFPPISIDGVMNASRKAPSTENLPAEFVTEVEGTTVRYATDGMHNTSYGLWQQTGYKCDLTFSADGQTVYIPHLIPGAEKAGTFLKGSVTTAENGRRTISIPANQLLNCYETFDDYMLARVGMTAQEYAEQKGTTVAALKRSAGWMGPMYFYFVPAKASADGKSAVLLDEYVLVEDADGNFIHRSSELRLYLFSYYYGTTRGYIAAAANMDFIKIKHEACVVPDDVEWRQFSHQWDASIFWDGAQMCQIGFKGDKVYIPGLVPDIHDAYAEGTIDADGIITINSQPLFFTSETNYYHTIGCVDSSVGYDDNMNLVYNQEFPNYKLRYDRQRGTLLPIDDMRIIDYYCYGQIGDFYAHKYKLYEKDTPATPAAPTNLMFKEEDGFEWFAFEMRAVDDEGFYINPEKISYQCFLNDKPYVFTPDRYESLNQEADEIPMTFTDPSMDFVYDQGWIQVYWYERDWITFGIRSVYTVDGEKRYSPIVWVTNTNSAISLVSADGKSPQAYDLFGRRVSHEYKGLVIKNGRKYIQR